MLSASSCWGACATALPSCTARSALVAAAAWQGPPCAVAAVYGVSQGEKNANAQGGFVLGLELPEDDQFYDDKADILEVAGLAEASSFQLRADAEPPSQLLAFLRLLNLSGESGLLRAGGAEACQGLRMG